MKKKQSQSICLDKWEKLFLMMRITILLLLTGLIHVSASVYSQKTSLELKLKDVSVEEVFQNIEEQSKFYFLYRSDFLKNLPRVSIDVTGARVEEILNQIIVPYGFTYEIDEKIVVIRRSSESLLLNKQDQRVSIRGKITDSSSVPLPGVSITIKGTTRGTISDAGGQYSLSDVSPDATLVFSFVGMKTQEIPVAGKTSISITLVEDAIGIDEVVAIGYGLQKKSNLTFSVSRIGDEAIKDRPITNMGEALAGQLSGVRAQNTTGIPGADLSIQIRGINTINGNSSPLYVIDDVPRNNMSDINPNDIASIQVLKDASATSIYGSRGANGVILIETKQGSGKTTVNVDAYYGIQEPVKMYEKINGPEWVAYMTYVRNESWLRQGGSMKDPMSARPAALQIPASWTDGSRPPVDWQDVITTVAPIQSYQISASSKTDNGSIYASGGFTDQSGIIKETFYNLVNFRGNAILNAGDHVKFGVSIAPSFSKQADQNTQGKETVIHHAIAQPPLIQLNEGTEEYGYPSDFPLVYANPLERLRRVTDDTEKGKILSSIWAEYAVVEGLKLKSLYSYDYQTTVYEYFMPPMKAGNIPAGSSSTQRDIDWSFQNTLNYNLTIGKRHNFDILLGQSADEHKYYLIEASATGFPNSTVRTLNVATTPTKASTFKERNTTMSFFSRISYNFKDKYLINTSVRRDGSSRFGVNNKWGLFPSVSAAWKLNAETFLADRTWLSLLKVRASWGTAGNDRIGNYDYMALLTVDNTAWNNSIQGGLAPNNIGNNDLKWESTSTTDLGLDISVLKNRIQFNFDYYINKTNDLLFNVPVPYSTGFNTFRTNLGEIENRGWDLDLKTHHAMGNVKWVSSLNLSANKNKVIDMGDVDEFTTANWDAKFITRVGHPVAQYYVYRTDGVLQPSDFDATGLPVVATLSGQVAGNTKYVNQNEDMVINSSDLVPYGSNLPDLIFGFTNQFEYKGIQLSVLLQGQFGGELLWLGQRQIDDGNIYTNSLRRWLRSWKPDYEAIYGPGEDPVPSVSGVDMSWDGKTPYVLAGKKDNNSDLRIYDATFLKIKNVSLSYDLPKGILRGSPLRAARAYVSIDNLATFDKYPGVTTESNSFGNETTRAGVDYTTYPLSRRYTIGLNLTF